MESNLGEHRKLRRGILQPTNNVNAVGKGMNLRLNVKKTSDRS